MDARRTSKDQEARGYISIAAKSLRASEQRSRSQNAELGNIPIKPLNDFLCKEPRASQAHALTRGAVLLGLRFTFGADIDRDKEI